MTRIAIIGYGNLGKACESIAVSNNDYELIGIFTRRNPKDLTSPYGTRFFEQEEIYSHKDEIDVAIICTGSMSDVTDLGVRLAAHFNTVDSFDTHAKIPKYFEEMSRTAQENNNLCFVSIGWDPGLFSMMRVLFTNILPDGVTHTFWGRGVSQGHSEAIRKIDGVLDAKQYTVPKSEALMLAREGGGAWLNDRDKHLRECYVAVSDGADKSNIERQIKTMPNYFEPYDTVVNFVSKEELMLNHSAMPHAGLVLRSGKVNEKAQNLEFSLKLESNPDFTASVLMAYAKANAYLAKSGEVGARTALDIPISALFCGKYDMSKFV